MDQVIKLTDFLVRIKEVTAKVLMAHGSGLLQVQVVFLQVLQGDILDSDHRAGTEKCCLVSCHENRRVRRVTVDLLYFVLLENQVSSRLYPDWLVTNPGWQAVRIALSIS